MELITKDMIDNYHYVAGEDFIDQTEHLFNGTTLSSFMAGMRQQIAPALWVEMNETRDNKRTYSVQQTLGLYEDIFGYEEGTELFYEDLVVALNTTTVSRKRALKVLKFEDNEEDED